MGFVLPILPLWQVDVRLAYADRFPVALLPRVEDPQLVVRLRAKERIGYIAVESGLASFPDVDGDAIELQTLLTGTVVSGWANTSGAGTSISFTSPFAAPPKIVASQSTRNGGDGGWLRTGAIAAGSVALLIDEDTAKDADRSHANEQASLLGFSEPFIYRGDPIPFYPLDIDPAIQGNLLSALGVPNPLPPKNQSTEIITYQRRKKSRDGAVTDSGLRFTDDVPREVIRVTDPAIEAIPEDRRVLIGEKVTYRLAQRPGSYVILEYTRPVYKLLEDQRILTTPAPANVLDKSVADVSFLAGMLIDKFCYHLPLYRQHQRLMQSGIRLSRSSLTTWAGRAIDLLRPIVDAQSRHLLQSRILAMDETPIKAGRKKKGKMRQAYLWPIYGDGDEMVFHYAESRVHHHVQTFLGDFNGTLLSDGYEAMRPMPGNGTL